MKIDWSFSAIAYAYILCVGALYVLGFWTVLHFNILEFLTPLDILKSAVYPLLPASIFSLFGALLDASKTRPLPKTDASTPKFERFMTNMLAITLIVLVALNIVTLAGQIYFVIFSMPEERLYYALPVFSFAATIYFLFNPPFLKEQTHFVRNSVIIFLCLLPTVSYMQGRKNISEILSQDAAYYYLSNSSPACKITNNQKMIYLGYHGELHFFVSSTERSICLEPEKGIQLSYFTPQEKPKTESFFEQFKRIHARQG